MQAVFGELEKLKVAMSVRQVQAAAAELRHAKRKLEIQAELKKEKVRCELGCAQLLDDGLVVCGMVASF